MHLALPVVGDSAAWARCRLIERMMLGRREAWSFENPLVTVVVVPLLARLEAGDDRVPGSPIMGSGVLCG